MNAVAAVALVAGLGFALSGSSQEPTSPTSTVPAAAGATTSTPATPAAPAPAGSESAAISNAQLLDELERIEAYLRQNFCPQGTGEDSNRSQWCNDVLSYAFRGGDVLEVRTDLRMDTSAAEPALGVCEFLNDASAEVLNRDVYVVVKGANDGLVALERPGSTTCSVNPELVPAS